MVVVMVVVGGNGKVAGVRLGALTLASPAILVPAGPDTMDPGLWQFHRHRVLPETRSRAVDRADLRHNPRLDDALPEGRPHPRAGRGNRADACPADRGTDARRRQERARAAAPQDDRPDEAAPRDSGP